MNRREGNQAARGRRWEDNAVVLGANEVGSAVAVALHQAGWTVVLIDDVDPGNPWRGMSFVNAWYMGSTELDGVAACFCASVRSIPSVIERRGLIAATTWSWQAVARCVAADPLVDTRTADGGVTTLSKDDVPDGVLVVGCGTGHRAGSGADLVVDTRYDVERYTVLSDGSTSASLGARPRLADMGDERFVVAPCTGRFRTQASLADSIEARETIGDVGGQRLEAPSSGIFRAISARGAKVVAGDVVAEIDARSDPALCYGVDPRGAAIARAVCEALDAHRPRRSRAGGGLRPPRVAQGPVGDAQVAVAPARRSTSSRLAASSAAVPE